MTTEARAGGRRKRGSTESHSQNPAMKSEQVKEVVDKLSAGCAVYIHGGTHSYPVPRAGVTKDGELWYQIGQTAHRAGPLTSCVEVGCGWTFERDGHSVLFVLPEDADDWEQGLFMTALDAARQSVKLDDLLQTV